MIKGLFESHLPFSNLEDSIDFYEKLGLKLESIIPNKVAFLWIVENKSWLGLWETDITKYPYHPSIRHVGFEGKEPFVSPHKDKAYAKIHFYDLDKNSLEFITELKNPKHELKKMYLSDWLEDN